MPPRLLAVIGAAGIVATRYKLARLSELFGITGCLPPRLPAQIDQRAFFEAMQGLLTMEPEEEESRASGEVRDALPSTLRLLRQDLQAARLRTYDWFLALAGISDDNEQRILLAAMSLVGGKADQLERWIVDQAPSRVEVEMLLQEVRRWHHKTAIIQQRIPDLLRSAAEQIKRPWRQLRADTAFTGGNE